MVKQNLKPLRDHEVGQTCAEQMIECVDSARQLLTDFGLRPYRVFLVWVRWTADEDADGRIGSSPADANVRTEEQTDLTAFTEDDLEDEIEGVGRAVLAHEMELLPTPNVSSLGGIGKDQDAVGLTERGAISIDQISARYSEDLLMGLVAPFRDEEYPDTLKEGISFFWEVRHNRPGGYVAPGYAGCENPQELRTNRRRFHVSGTPHHDAAGFEWTVTLRRADGERGRNGEVEVVG